MNWLVTLTVLFCIPTAWAQEPLTEFAQQLHIDPRDRAAQERGAATFFQYCAGCHSLKHMRYTDLAHHFQWVDAQGHLKKDMIFEYLNYINDNPASPILTSLDPSMATQWFGKMPPDLSLVTRARSPQWVASMLTGFYPDSEKATGVSNHMFPSQFGMPHVLIEREQWAPLSDQRADKTDPKPYLLHPDSEEHYQQVVSDLVHFLDYVGEPHRLEREKIGKYVLLFLIAMSCMNYLYYKSVWSDVDDH